MYQATLTSKGQITVPADVREALGLTQGDGLVFDLREGYAIVRRRPRLEEVLARIAGEPPIGTSTVRGDDEALRARFAEPEGVPGSTSVYLCAPGRCIRLGRRRGGGSARGA